MHVIRKAALCLILLAAACFAQSSEGSPVNQTIGAPPKPFQVIYDYAGGNTLTYIGYALSDQISTVTITVSAATNANPVSFTATAHGFDYQAKATILPTVCISGATGNWTPINGCWTATPTDANDFTIPVNSTAFGALTGTLVVTTRAPLTSSPIWAINKLVYDGSNRLIWSGWATNPGGAGAVNPVASSTSGEFIWANRATLGYQ